MRHYQNLTFYDSIGYISQLPANSMKEIAITGRSNVGKSSVLNLLSNQKKLARTSKQPGRTQLLNFFQIEHGYYLVDFPGYGYSKVSKKQIQHWHALIDHYLTTRQNLVGIVLIVDLRHVFKPFEIMMLDFAIQIDTPIHVVLNKEDKLKQNEKMKQYHYASKYIDGFSPELVSYQLFSTVNAKGKTQLINQLNHWFDA
jgi:GTP-binding protein